MFIRNVLIAIISATALYGGVATSAAGSNAPDDLSKWDLICFCNTVEYTPHRVLKADDNGRILFYASKGATKEQLAAASLKPLESQLMVLRDWHLLKKDGDIYTTSIPVLGPDRISHIRSVLHSIAAQVADHSRSDVAVIVRALRERHLDEHEYAVVFSYVLDGLVWERLDARSTAPNWDITASHPFWSGLFWATFPKREGVPGTNSRQLGNVTLRLMWTDETLPFISNLQSSPDVEAFLKSIKDGQANAAPIKSKDGEWRLVNADGTMQVPVIHERKGDVIYDAGMRISDALVSKLLEPKLLKSLKPYIPYASDYEESIIIAHEFIWSVLDAMLAKGEITKPAALRLGAQLTPETVRSLVVISVRDKKT
jgi:hypothetical protein